MIYQFLILNYMCIIIMKYLKLDDEKEKNINKTI